MYIYIYIYADTNTIWGHSRSTRGDPHGYLVQPDVASQNEASIKAQLSPSLSLFGIFTIMAQLELLVVAGVVGIVRRLAATQELVIVVVLSGRWPIFSLSCFGMLRTAEMVLLFEDFDGDCEL